MRNVVPVENVQRDVVVNFPDKYRSKRQIYKVINKFMSNGFLLDQKHDKSTSSVYRRKTGENISDVRISQK